MQNWLAGAVVVGALVYLFWRWRGTRRTGAGCSGCARVSESPGVRDSSEAVR